MKFTQQNELKHTTHWHTVIPYNKHLYLFLKMFPSLQIRSGPVTELGCWSQQLEERIALTRQNWRSLGAKPPGSSLKSVQRGREWSQWLFATPLISQVHRDLVRSCVFSLNSMMSQNQFTCMRRTPLRPTGERLAFHKSMTWKPGVTGVNSQPAIGKQNYYCDLYEKGSERGIDSVTSGRYVGESKPESWSNGRRG